MVPEEKGHTLNRTKNEHIHELQLEIGKAISERRINKGLSVSQVEAKTKISHSFIQDIELGNFDRLPGRHFGRGFIKNICVYLDLDPVPMVEKYERSWIHVPEVIKEGKTRSLSFFQREVANKLVFSPSIFKNFPINRFAIYLLVPIVFMALVFFVRYLSRQETNPVVEATPTTLTDNVVSKVVEPAKAPAKPMSMLKTEASKPILEKVEETLKASPGSSSVVILTVKEEVKIKHRIGPEEYTVTTFSPGEYRFPFAERADFVVFDAGAVEVSFNGKKLGSVGKKGEEKKLSFSAKEGPTDLEKMPEAKM